MALFSQRGMTYFNSRPYVRGDALSRQGLPDYVVFQFTPLREGRQSTRATAFWWSYFNSRPYVRGDTAA